MILLRRIKRYMKIKHKKVAASGIAVALAGVLGVGALLQTSVSVQASSAMMPGIEEIVSEASADKPFKILEIVDNTQDAEIGYYVSGRSHILNCILIHISTRTRIILSRRKQPFSDVGGRVGETAI